MKTCIGILFFLVCTALDAQRTVAPTDSIIVSGAIARTLVIHIDDLMRATPVSIGDVAVTNHKGELKSTMKNVKGVLLKELLRSMECVTEKPRELNTFILRCVASDGYTVVFSWNEIFNAPGGDHIFLVTEADGVPVRELTDRLLVLVPTDANTGRRHIRGLSRIEVVKL